MCQISKIRTTFPRILFQIWLWIRAATRKACMWVGKQREEGPLCFQGWSEALVAAAACERRCSAAASLPCWPWGFLWEAPSAASRCPPLASLSPAPSACVAPWSKSPSAFVGHQPPPVWRRRETGACSVVSFGCQFVLAPLHLTPSFSSQCQSC